MSTIHLLCNRSLYCDWKTKESPKLKKYDTTTDDYGQPLTPAGQKRLQKAIDTYLNAYQKGCQIYQTIAKGAISDLESFLPLTKDEYLPQNRNICLWDSGIRHPLPEYRKASYTLQILIKPSCAPVDPNNPDSIFDTTKDKTTGELWLTLAPPPKTISPVLDQDGKLQSVRVQKVTYLKQQDLIPGYIYQQKTGPDLLYLGHIHSVIQTESHLNTDQAYTTTGKPHEVFLYIKVNKTVEQALQNTHTIQEFFDHYSQACLAKHQDLQNNLFRSKQPRKMTAVVRQAFARPEDNVTLTFPVWEPLSKDITLFTETMQQLP